MPAAAAKNPWRSRIVGYGQVDPRQLTANPKNWRTHPDAQRGALEGVLSEVGWVAEVLVNRRTGFVVDGHLRVAAAVARGETSVPVRYVDLDDAEERLVLATLDPIAAQASTDAEQLSALLEGLQPADAAAARARTAAPKSAQSGRCGSDATRESDNAAGRLMAAWRAPVVVW